MICPLSRLLYNNVNIVARGGILKLLAGEAFKRIAVGLQGLDFPVHLLYPSVVVLYLPFLASYVNPGPYPGKEIRTRKEAHEQKGNKKGNEHEPEEGAPLPLES